MTENTEKKPSRWRWFQDHQERHRHLYIAIVGFLDALVFLWLLCEWRGEIPPDLPITPLLAAGPALAALDLAARRTAEMNRTNEIAEERNAIDIFSRAVEQLEHKDYVVRLGARATLRQLSENLDLPGREADKTRYLRETIVGILAFSVEESAIMRKERKDDDAV